MLASWLFPDGEQTELLLEACTALLGVLGLTVPHNEGSPSPLYLAMLRQVEVVVELVAERTLGADGKWGVLAALELAKAVLRLSTLYQAGGRVLIDDAAPSTSGAPLHLLHEQGGESSGQRTQRTLRAFAAFRAARLATPSGLANARLIAAVAHPPVLTPARAAPPEAQRAWTVLVTAECLRIARPTAYCLAVRMLGRRSWLPWMGALGMDVTSAALVRTVPLASDEKHELRRRRGLLLYYLLMPPAYGANVGVRRAVASLSSAPLPLFDALIPRLVSVLDGIAASHTYTSAG